jgi:hypothetical protein
MAKSSCLSRNGTHPPTFVLYRAVMNAGAIAGGPLSDSFDPNSRFRDRLLDEFVAALNAGFVNCVADRADHEPRIGAQTVRPLQLENSEPGMTLHGDGQGFNARSA